MLILPEGYTGLIESGLACSTGMMNISDCRVGQRVYFGRPNGQKTLGVVIKIGRSKVKVRSLECRGYRETSGEVWGVPVTLLTPENAGRPAQVTRRVQPVVGPDYSGQTESMLLENIRNIYCQLSPENLHCDGEISASEAHRRGVELRRHLQACFRALGRTVSEGEAYSLSVA